MKKLVIALIVMLSFMGCKTETFQREYSFPRTAASVARIQDWPLEYLVKHDMILGPSQAENIQHVLDGAKNNGYGDWADNVIIIQSFCWETIPVDILTNYPPAQTTMLPLWMYQMAVNNPMTAIQVAAWENYKLGCDWWAKDTSQQLIPIWPNYSGVDAGAPINWCLANWSPSCPNGRWNGSRIINGTVYNIGDTREKTLLQWMCGPMRDTVIKGSPIFSKYIDGIQLEDGGFIGVENWLLRPGQKVYVPGHPMGMNASEYRAYCLPLYEWYMENMLDALKSNLFFIMNGPHTRENKRNSPEYQLVYKYCNSPKLEAYGNWGGWPQEDTREWYAMWPQIESLYKKFGNSTNPAVNKIQGYDLSVAQCMPSRSWDDSRVEQWLRMHLATTLINGNGLFSASWYNDQYGYDYLSGEHNSWIGIENAPANPYLYFKLGSRVSYAQTYISPLHPNYPLYYAYFRNQSTSKDYTVVVNMWPVNIRWISANDGAWFEGRWPSPSATRVVL